MTGSSYYHTSNSPTLSMSSSSSASISKFFQKPMATMHPSTIEQTQTISPRKPRDWLTRSYSMSPTCFRHSHICTQFLPLCSTCECRLRQLKKKRSSFTQLCVELFQYLIFFEIFK